MRRRDFLKISAAAVSAPALITRASAQAASWPDRPVKIIVPYAPGGASDIVARPWAEALSQAFGQQFVIDYRGGAAGGIGTEAVSQSAPDGYTFLLTPSAAISILPLLRKTKYDPQKDFRPVGRVGDSLTGWVIHPSVGVKTMKETIEYARANPRKLKFGSSGLGSIQHLRIELLKYRTGVDIVHIPYKGSGESLNDLLANQIQMMCEINPLPHVKAGKLTLLAMNGARSPEFPDAPTLTEAGYGNAETQSWYVVWAPAKVPDDIMNKFHDKIVEIAKSDAMKKRMIANNVALPLGTRAEIEAYLDNDLKANAAVIKAADIKME